MIWLEAVAAALVGLALLALVLGPVLGERVAAAPDDEPLEMDETRRGVALLALREIEFDRETGKLSDEDYRMLKGRYTTEALDALREEGTPAPPDAAPVPAREDLEATIARRAEQLRRHAAAGLACPHCGPRPEPDAIYCSNCGRTIGRMAS